MMWTLLLFALLPRLAAADVDVDYATVVGDPPSAHGTNSISTIEDEAMWISRWQETSLGVIRIQIPQFFLEPVNDNADPDVVAWENFQFDTAIPIPPDFTRTVSFASAFNAMKEAGVPVDAVVDIDVPDEEIIKRMSGRRVHLASGRTYHIIFNPPKEEGKDDVSGEPLIQRDDDKEETVRKRLDVYHAQTEPLIDYYKNWESTGDAAAPTYIRIEGVGKVDEIRDRIFSALGDVS